MKLTMLFLLLFLTGAVQAQTQNSRTDIEKWKKAVVNIETESNDYADYVIDSLYPKKADGYTFAQMRKWEAKYFHTTIRMGTAIYVTYRERKYLITARHVLNDEILTDQKKHDNYKKPGTWENIESIYGRVSIRTPFDYYYYHKTDSINNYYVGNSDKYKGENPFFFISNINGDGIAVISLQANKYRVLDIALQKNGYIPLSIEDICQSEVLSELDEVISIGFPENLSIDRYFKIPLEEQTDLHQKPDVVLSFIVKGYIAMHNPVIEYYYADLTITHGDSGSPVIKNDRLVGIVSKINSYKIVDANNDPAKEKLFGIGRLATIMKISSLLKKLNEFQPVEDRILQKEK